MTEPLPPHLTRFHDDPAFGARVIEVAARTGTARWLVAKILHADDDPDVAAVADGMTGGRRD